MRGLIASILFVICVDLLFNSCANIASPTGGPRDTIPPVLLSSTPTNGQTNYTSQEFSLTFSEFVKADKIQQQLIITPRTDIKYKTTIKKNTVILKFDEPFEDSTTYNLNFADAVTDITESNPAINLSLAFSTGNYIDSLSLKGLVIDLFEQEKVKGYLVGLYPRTDTLDYFKHQPTYFTTTSDSGEFELQYLKDGIYNLLVFEDGNRNITFDPETESHGFVQDSIQLDSSITLTKQIATLLQNIKPITFINSRPTGPYIELKYSKHIDTYTLTPSILRHSLTGDSREVIRIYKNEDTATGDTLQIISSVYDSLGNETIDTVRTAFIESNRKPSSFTSNVRPVENFQTDSLQLKVVFNKPVYTLDSTKIYFEKDSTYRQGIDPTLIWNQNHTEVLLNTNITRQYLADTIRALLPKDTTSTEDDNRQPEKKEKPLPPVQLVLDTAAFLSIENDSSNFLSLKVPLRESTEFGTVKLTVQTLQQHFTIQLINGKGQVTHSQSNQTNITFSKVQPGTYTIRSLIDNDGDGKWSAGNLLLNKIPEDLYLHPEETVVRENWVLEIDIFF